MRRVGVVSAVIVVGASLALGGIAGAKPLSPKKFRAQADAICEDGNAALAELGEQHFGGLGPDEVPTLDALTAWIGDVEPVVQDQIDSIADLDAPKKLRKKVKRLLATARDELDAVVDDPSIALESDPFADTKLISSDLGLPACAGETGEGSA